MRIMLFVAASKFGQADIQIKEQLASILQTFTLISLHIQSASSSSNTTMVTSMIRNNTQNSQAIIDTTREQNLKITQSNNNGKKEEKKFAFIIDNSNISFEKMVNYFAFILNTNK